MSVLVTGGSGLVGKYLQDIAPDWIYLSSKDYNLLSQKEASSLIIEYSPKWIIHLAAKVGGIMDNKTYPCDYYEENMLMGLNLLRAARIAKVPNFTAILSTCAYPDSVNNEQLTMNNESPYPLHEEFLHAGPPTEANFGYGISKRAIATHIDMCNKQYKTNYNYLIPCNLYGKYDNYNLESSHYVAALIKKIYLAEKNNTELELFGTGKPLRQFMYAKDFALIIKGMVERKITSSFNVATPEVLSIDEIAQVALQCTGVNINHVFNSKYPDGQYRKDVSIEKFKSLFPEFQFTSLYDGIRKTYQDFKKSMEG